jgi:hypothetical protein
VDRPTVKVNGITVATDNFSLSEVMYGVGITDYLMPSDIFLSGALGIGAFVIDNETKKTITRTNSGFAFQVKAGKHWWVSNKWGMALSIAYGTTSASDSESDVYGNHINDNVSSSRVTVGISIGMH